MRTVREAVLSALTYAAAIAIGAAAVRAMAIPRLLGPALLTLAFYLWDAVQAATPARRRDARWIWQMVLLVVLGVGRRGLEPAAALNPVRFDARAIRC